MMQWASRVVKAPKGIASLYCLCFYWTCSYQTSAMSIDDEEWVTTPPRRRSVCCFWLTPSISDIAVTVVPLFQKLRFLLEPLPCKWQNIHFICCFYWPVCIQSNRKRSVSLMVSPITDEESIEYVAFWSVFVYFNIHFSRMMPSPTKAVRFQKDDVLSAPLKGVLKKPEVVIPRWVRCGI